MPPSDPVFRRATTSVLVAVALIGGSILLLGDRFGPAPSAALARPVRVEARIAACVADESMRLIDRGRESCHPDEQELAAGRVDGPPPIAPGGPAGPAGRPGADGVSGFEIVTAPLSVPARDRGTGLARCPAGKVALGGGVRPDPDAARRQGPSAPEAAIELAASGPIAADGGGYGWAATVRNTAAAPLAVIVAVICAAAR